MAEKLANVLVNFKIKEISIAHVIVVAGGQYNFQVNPNQLARLFGDFGLGTFGPVENGFKVELGPTNEVVFQLPRILFKAANEATLKEAYKNALAPLLGPVSGKAAVAFGVNFDFDVQFKEVEPKEALRSLGSTSLPGGLEVTSLGFRRQIPLTKNATFNCTISFSPDEQKALRFHVNNDFQEPGMAFLSLADLEGEFRQARQYFKEFLGEMEPCLKPMI